jgi:guanylate kinase
MSQFTILLLSDTLRQRKVAHDLYELFEDFGYFILSQRRFVPSDDTSRRVEEYAKDHLKREVEHLLKCHPFTAMLLSRGETEKIKLCPHGDVSHFIKIYVPTFSFVIDEISDLSLAAKKAICWHAGVVPRELIPYQRSPTPTLVLFGPSGAGKTTIQKLLVDLYPKKYSSAVSTTTRSQREGEIVDQDYHFVSDGDFCAKIDGSEFVEHVKYSEKRYGLTYSAIEKARNLGKSIPVVVMTGTGIDQLLNYGVMLALNPIFIYVTCSSAQERKMRMLARGDSKESVESRVSLFSEEYEYARANLNKFYTTCHNEDGMQYQCVYELNLTVDRFRAGLKELKG